MATSSLPRKPVIMANGKKISGRITNLIMVAVIVGLIFARALRPSNVAPTTRSAIGLAVPPMLLITFNGMYGIGIRQNAKTQPARIPIIIGFLITFIKAFLIFITLLI